MFLLSEKAIGPTEPRGNWAPWSRRETEVKNVWSYTSTPLKASLECRGYHYLFLFIKLRQQLQELLNIHF
jgi:hypothetical protein